MSYNFKVVVEAENFYEEIKKIKDKRKMESISVYAL
jgi:hypothetical protein